MEIQVSFEGKFEVDIYWTTSKIVGKYSECNYDSEEVGTQPIL